MAEGVTLNRAGLSLVAGAITAGAASLAAVLHFIVAAPLTFIILMVCFTPAAVILLLYIGYLVSSGASKRHYIPPLQAVGLASVCLGLLIFLDLSLPAGTTVANVTARFTRDGQALIHAGGYKEQVAVEFYNKTFEGSAVMIETTPLFHQLVSIGSSELGLLGYYRSDIKQYLMVAMGAIFVFPVLLFRLVPKAQKIRRDMFTYGLVIVPSYMISLIACGVWVKLVLVHVFGTIGKM